MQARALVLLLVLAACGGANPSSPAATPSSAGPHIFWSNWSGGSGTTPDWDHDRLTRRIT